MINNIRISPERRLFPDEEYIGVVGEHNAEVLIFKKPEEINGQNIDEFDMRVIFNNANGSYIRDIPNDKDSVSLNAALTTGETLIVIVQFLYTNKVRWTSEPLTLYLHGGGDESGEHSGDDSETMLAELATSLKEMCGDSIETMHNGTLEFPDFSEMTYEQLLSFLVTIKNMVATGLEKVDDSLSDTKYWTFGEILQSLYDFSFDKIHSLESGVLDLYRNNRQIDYNEFMESDFVKELFALRASHPYWEEIYIFASAVIDKLSTEVDSDNLESVKQHFQEVYGGNWSRAKNWRALFSDHKFVINDMYSIITEQTGVEPQSYSEFTDALRNLKPAIIATITNSLYGFYSKYV